MDVYDKIQQVCKLLNAIDDDYQQALKVKNLTDGKTQDVLHYLEFNNPTTTSGRQLAKELHRVRLDRRQAKDNIEMYQRFVRYQNRLVNKNNRPMLLAELSKLHNRFNVRSYDNRVYAHGELEQLTKYWTDDLTQTK